MEARAAAVARAAAAMVVVAKAAAVASWAVAARAKQRVELQAERLIAALRWTQSCYTGGCSRLGCSLLRGSDEKDTTRVAKLPPKSVQQKLIPNGKDKPRFDNETLYNALTPQTGRGDVDWHQAFEDARATAAWLSSDETRRVLAQGELGDSVVSLAQTTLMVHAKWEEGRKGQK